ncbi:hypothetical protein FCI23_40760 [Actinacidiphila oryziradicis]|uniref:Uncharacterized protein n=1 Tax=Actinacidiphila oryziradicis TaxID=2571141 RepID=A0A4U0RYD1_9ACTN|nr:hypothetical protein FCI23_40760 [Actinacidiphila oryziradicis]
MLADFRDRLAQSDRSDRLLNLALARIKEAGLVHERTLQRTDSTHVLGAVRDLTRLELVTEAVRSALEEIARTAPHLLAGLVDEAPHRCLVLATRPPPRRRRPPPRARALVHDQDRPVTVRHGRQAPPHGHRRPISAHPACPPGLPTRPAHPACPPGLPTRPAHPAWPAHRPGNPRRPAGMGRRQPRLHRVNTQVRQNVESREAGRWFISITDLTGLGNRVLAHLRLACRTACGCACRGRQPVVEPRGPRRAPNPAATSLPAAAPGMGDGGQMPTGRGRLHFLRGELVARRPLSVARGSIPTYGWQREQRRGVRCRSV